MSQQPPKKSGSRDINELKARLGLKKGAAAPGPGPASTKPNGSASGGVVPPPGLAVPPPPGAGPQQPVIPNAADDPFGAMNAMAQAGAATRAPEIIIVNDGKPVESVSAGTRGAQIGKYIAIALVPFIIGIAIRGISKDANAYNEGINGAKALLADVKAVKKSLAQTKAKIENDAAIKKEGMRGKAMTALLQDLHPEKLEVKLGPAISRKQNIGDTLALSVMEFYTEVANLQQLVKEHQARSKADDMLIAAARANESKADLPADNPYSKLGIKYRYGVLIWSPSEEEAKINPGVGAQLVELGPPYCNGNLAASGTCPEGVMPDAIAYRTAPGEGWKKADIFTDRGSSVPGNKVMVMMPTEVFGNFVIDCANGAGGDGCTKNIGGSASITLYEKRVENIMKKLGEIIELGNGLEAKLTPKATESPRFTFFM